MKIGIVITHPTQFDVPIYRLGKDIIEVIYTDASMVKEVYDPEMQRIVTFQKGNLEGYSFEVLSPGKKGLIYLYNKIKERKFDLLITNGYNNKAYLIAALAGKLYCKKNALRLDTVWYNNQHFFNKIYKKLIFILIRKTYNHFFVVSTLAKKFLNIYNIFDNNISFYGYISDSLFFRSNSNISEEEKSSLKLKYEIKQDQKILLCISKHNEREAPFDTIAAFAILNDPSLHLLLIGDGPLHFKLQEKAKQHNIENISFAGYINFTLLPKYYAIANIFIHDSHNEPWGVSLQEAIACGVSVIASNKVGASYDLIENGVNGYVFEAGNIHELSQKMIHILSLSKVKKSILNQTLLEKWSYEKTYSNILESVY
jgi:glycosyltransferase involved in cell wall biosynthesis